MLKAVEERERETDSANKLICTSIASHYSSKRSGSLSSTGQNKQSENSQSLRPKTGFKSDFFVGFEVLPAVVLESSIFWDTTPCSLLKVNQYFGGIQQ
jgi:hypothetical protein